MSIARRFFRGAISVVTNSGYWRKHEVAPRAHLNDGKLDIFEVSGAMRWSQRRMMWQKAEVGSHLPHPLLSYSQGEFFHWKGSPQRLVIDGQFVGMVTNVSCRVQSDCAQVYA
jgi:diacylglycerol kinase family enzyme